MILYNLSRVKASHVVIAQVNSGHTLQISFFLFRIASHLKTQWQLRNEAVLEKRPVMGNISQFRSL